MRRPRTRTLVLGVAVLAVIAFFLPPLVNANRFRARITRAIEQATGRKVTVGNVSLRLLPQPGFQLARFVVADDPAFSAEPMLRADSVTAALRLSSLWRGRLEIAKLSLDNPSLNLVRGSNDRWNIEALLERTRQTPTAPTAQPRAEVRPRFPYIEADGGRINLKFGAEKKPYSLSEADFALWLASENEWRMRLAGRPVRTDVSLSDSGTLKVTGRFVRAASLRETPLEFRLTLERAQLGQLTKLIYGRDRGWRGAVDLNATLAGTPAGLKISTQASLNDFRRYDINTVEKLRLEARCEAQYSTASQQITELACDLPMGEGVASARGEVRPGGTPAFDITFAAQKIPLPVLVTVARHVKKDIPEDLTASGTLDASFTVRRSERWPAVWSGGGETSQVTLRSAVLGPELSLPKLQFLLEGPGSEVFDPIRNAAAVALPFSPPGPGSRSRAKRNGTRAVAEMRLTVLPLQVGLGAAAPAQAHGWFSGSAYEFDLTGDGDLTRILQTGRAAGLRVPQMKVDGLVRMDLQIGGNWAGLAAPVVTGTAQLRNVKAKLNGFSAPLLVDSANLALLPGGVTAQNLVASFEKLPLAFTGSVRLARGCERLEDCPVDFDLRADQLSTEALNRLLNPNLEKRPWYDILGGEPAPSVLARVFARGHLTAGRLAMRSVVAGHVSAYAQLAGGKLVLSNVQAEMLGGRHRGEWQADFTGAEPKYSGSGTLDNVAMAQVSALMRDNWASGPVSATYSAAMSGWSASALLASATATVKFNWRNGALRHVTLDAARSAPELATAAPLQFRQFAGQLDFRQNAVTVAESKMTTAAGIYQVSGTASLARPRATRRAAGAVAIELNLNLRNGTHAYTISGALDSPHVVPASAETQAALKAE